MTTLLQNTAVVGIGQTEFSKFSGRSELQLAVEASKAALDDAGLTPADIDGMVTFKMDPNDELARIFAQIGRRIAESEDSAEGGHS